MELTENLENQGHQVEISMAKEVIFSNSKILRLTFQEVKGDQDKMVIKEQTENKLKIKY